MKVLIFIALFSLIIDIQIGNEEKLNQQIQTYTFGNKQKFDDSNSFFITSFSKKKDNKLNFLFFYQLEEDGGKFTFILEGPNNYSEIASIDNREKLGSYCLGEGDSGSYNISFISNEKLNGIFRIISTSEEYYKFDIKDNLKINECIFTSQTNPEKLGITFTSDLGINVYYIYFKKILVGGEENKLLNLITFKNEAYNRYPDLITNFYAFISNYFTYDIYIKYTDLGDNQYKLEQFSMENCTSYIDDLEFGIKTYSDREITFIIVDFRKTPEFSINILKNNPTIKIRYYERSMMVPEDINTKEFYNITDYDNIKRETQNYNYAVIYINFSPGENIINFINKHVYDTILDRDNKFDINYSKYKFEYPKNTKIIDILLITFTLESIPTNSDVEFTIKLNGLYNYERIKNIKTKKLSNTIAFDIFYKGNYSIIFEGLNYEIKGTFKILSPEEEYSLKNNEFLLHDKIFAYGFEPSPIKVNNPFSYLIGKKITILDTNEEDFAKLVSVKYDTEEYTPVYCNYYYNDLLIENHFQFKFKSDQYNYYTLNPFYFEDFNFTNNFDYLSSLSEKKEYDNMETKFLLVNLTQINKFEIKEKSNSAKFKLAYFKEPLSYIYFPIGFNQLQFKTLKSDKLRVKKNNGNNYAALIIELEKEKTTIEFNDYIDDGDDGGDNDNENVPEGGGDNPSNEANTRGKDDNDDTINKEVLYFGIILPISVVLILILVFLICRYHKKKKANNQDELMSKVMKE